MVRRTARIAWYESPWRIAGRAMTIALAVVFVAVIATIAVIPRLLGGTTLTVLSGSMLPVLAPGDVVAVRGVTPDTACAVGIGAIVTYLPQPGQPDLVTHRVVAKTIGTFDDGTACRLVTQGDANSAVDEPVSPIQVRGEFLYGIPKLGWASQWVGQHRTLALGVGIVVVAAALLGGRSRIVAVQAAGYPGQPGDPHLGQPGGYRSGQPGGYQPGQFAGFTVGYPAGPGFAPVPVDPMDDVERALRLRELAVREREVAIREAELGLVAPVTPEPVPEAKHMTEPATYLMTEALTAPTPVAPLALREVIV